MIEKKNNRNRFSVISTSSHCFFSTKTYNLIIKKYNTLDPLPPLYIRGYVTDKTLVFLFNSVFVFKSFNAYVLKSLKSVVAYYTVED